MHTTHDAVEPAPMPHESPLQSVHSLGRDEGSLSLNELTVLCTSLSKKVEGLESELKQTKQTYSTALTKLIKRVKKLEQTINTSQFRRRARVDAEIQGRTSADTKILQEQETPTELIEDLGSGEKGEKEISTANVPVSTAGAEVSTANPNVSTAAECLVYIRRSETRRKDKGKAIMQESKPPKKIKKRVQVQMSVDEELAQKVHEEEQARFNAEQEARFKAEQEQERIYFETALKLQKQLDERKEVVAEATQTHDIDWSDPAVIRYHTLQNRPFSVAELRKNMYSEKKTGGSRKKTLARKRAGEKQSDESDKRQKKKDDAEKEDFTEYLNIVPEEGMHVEALQTKYAKEFDRDDLVKLWSIVQERSNSPGLIEDKEKELWVELKRLFEPNDDDELWKSQRYMHDPLTWRLYDTCGVHHVSSTKGHDIFMLVEKDYPLSIAILTLMFVAKLQVDQRLGMSDELLKKIYILENRSRMGGLLGINLHMLVLLVEEVSTAQNITTSTNFQAATASPFFRRRRQARVLGSSNLTADPDVVSVVQTASQLSPDVVWEIPDGVSRAWS
ncbi:hypothetical protein Tco_1237198 [Tanacetum coccineum]